MLGGPVPRCLTNALFAAPVSLMLLTLLDADEETVIVQHRDWGWYEQFPAAGRLPAKLHGVIFLRAKTERNRSSDEQRKLTFLHILTWKKLYFYFNLPELTRLK